MKNEKQNKNLKDRKELKKVNAEISDSDLDKVAGGFAVAADDKDKINQEFMQSQSSNP